MNIILDKEETNSLLVEIGEAIDRVQLSNSAVISVRDLNYAVSIHLQLTQLVTPYFLHLYWLANANYSDSDIYKRAYDKLRLEIEEELDISIVCYRGTFYKPKEDHLHAVHGFGFTVNDTHALSKKNTYAILDQHEHDSDIIFEKLLCSTTEAFNWTDELIHDMLDSRTEFDLKPIKNVLNEMKQLLTFKGTLMLDIDTCKIIEDLFIESTNS